MSGYKYVTEELFEIVKTNIRIVLEKNGSRNNSNSEIEYYAATTLGFNNHNQLKDVLNINKKDFIDFSHTTDDEVIDVILNNQDIKNEILNAGSNNWEINEIINNVNGFIEIPKGRFNNNLKEKLIKFYNK